MDATFLLADWAEAINGKLYIQGAGWNAWKRRGPTRCGIALLIRVGWNETNQKHRAVIRLLDPDGQAVEPTAGTPVVIEAEFEVGRPAGVQEGTDFPFPVAANMQLPLKQGRYRFSLEIDDKPVGQGATFDVLEGMPKTEE